MAQPSGCAVNTSVLPPANSASRWRMAIAMRPFASSGITAAPWNATAIPVLHLAAAEKLGFRFVPLFHHFLLRFPTLCEKARDGQASDRVFLKPDNDLATLSRGRN